MSDWVRRQIDKAEADDNVRALIVRIVSPGGAVSSSDQIHHYINRFKNRTGKPVLGFMQSVAASGGYYSAVACDEIMAEPTVITGSIGVIMNYMVVKELLEEKLGINPVTIKSGKHKDWPSMFNETTDEQKQYLNEKTHHPPRMTDLWNWLPKDAGNVSDRTGSSSTGRRQYFFRTGSGRKQTDR